MEPKCPFSIGSDFDAIVQPMTHNPENVVLAAKNGDLTSLTFRYLEINEEILDLLGAPQPQGAETVAGFAGPEEERQGDPVSVHDGFSGIGTELGCSVVIKESYLHPVVQKGE